MGHYVSIRGWMDCPDDQLPEIKNIIRSYEGRAADYGLTKEGAEMYNLGWIIPEEHINWTHYIFYGADIRIQYLDFIGDQIRELAEKIYEIDEPYTDRMNGRFDIDDEMEELKFIWQIIEGDFNSIKLEAKNSKES